MLGDQDGKILLTSELVQDDLYETAIESIRLWKKKRIARWEKEWKPMGLPFIMEEFEYVGRRHYTIDGEAEPHMAHFYFKYGEMFAHTFAGRDWDASADDITFIDSPVVLDINALMKETTVVVEK